MRLIESDRGVLVMGDLWDYKIKKMEMAWELALRVIPKSPHETGRWTERDYLKSSQDEIRQAFEVIDAIFTDA